MARSVNTWTGVGLSTVLALALSLLLSRELTALGQPGCGKANLVLASMLLSAVGSLAAFVLSLLTRGPETIIGVEGLGFRVYGPPALLLMWVLGSAAFTAMFLVSASPG